MAIQCKNCGQLLPRDDARFCNNCGTPTSTDAPISKPVPSTLPENASLPPALPSVGKSGDSRPALREQIAYEYQPPTRPAKRPTSDEPPSWLGQLEELSRQSVARNKSSQAGSSPGRMRTDQKQNTPGKGHDSPQEDFPVPEPMHQPAPSVRELRVKVWERDEPLSSPLDEQEEEPASEEEDAVEDLPTAPLGATPPELLIQRASTPPPVRMRQNPQRDEVELLDTLPLLAQKPANPLTQPSPEVAKQQASSGQSQIESMERIPSLKPVVATPVPPQTAQAVRGSSNSRSLPPVSRPGQQWSPPQPPSTPWAASAPPATHHKSSRKPLVFVLLPLCLLLLLGGLVTWIVLAQPFTVAPITRPWQDYQNTALGVSLAYPTGWNKQEDQKNRAVHFYDTSYTVQVNLAVADANGQSVSEYLQKQVTTLGLTGAKAGAPLTFAGASWQQMQGSVQQKGATYTEVVLVTLRGNHLITLTQLAPQARYTDAEQTIFSYMRSSFRFLS